VATLEYKLKPEDSFAMRHLQLRGQAKHYTAVLRPLTARSSPVTAELLQQDGQVIGVRVKGDGVDDTISFAPGYSAVIRRAGETRQVSFDQ
jgi:hypothetical protein